MGDVVGGMFLGFGIASLVFMFMVGRMVSTMTLMVTQLDRLERRVCNLNSEPDTFGENWISGDEPWAETSED